MFRHAIVRPPGPSFTDGLTTASFGKPDLELATVQHKAYCAALTDCGLQIHCLAPDERYPDSTFVEDTAVLTPDFAILARPGADSRQGEVDAITPAIRSFYSTVYSIRAPGTLDGGDICEAGNHFFVGVSQRTNEEGARQFAEIVANHGHTARLVDIRGMSSILHLKSGLAYLGDDRLLLMKELVEREEFAGYESISIPHSETYGCNCVLVNDAVLVPAGFPQVSSELARLGYSTIELDMSEFRKMDGGLSCLSLRF
jgi:dimethylargininase